MDMGMQYHEFLSRGRIRQASYMALATICELTELEYADDVVQNLSGLSDINT